MHIAAVGSQIYDRVPDDLPWAVIRDITATAGFVRLDPKSPELGLGGDDMGTAPASYPERNDRRVLEQQQKIGNAFGAPLLDERLLKLQRLVI